MPYYNRIGISRSILTPLGEVYGDLGHNFLVEKPNHSGGKEEKSERRGTCPAGGTMPTGGE